MFLAEATFEVIENPNPDSAVFEDGDSKMSLVSLENVREVAAVPEGQYATYDQIIKTLMMVLPDWAAFAGQMPGMKRQYHTLRFESREEAEQLSGSINR